MRSGYYKIEFSDKRNGVKDVYRFENNKWYYYNTYYKEWCTCMNNIPVYDDMSSFIPINDSEAMLIVLQLEVE